MREELETFAAGPSPLETLLGNGPRAYKVIPLPGPRFAGRPEAQVAIIELMDWELRTARLEALRFLTDTCKMTEAHMAMDTSLGDEEVKTQILYAALRDPLQPDRKFARSAMAWRTGLTPDEREALYNAYLEFVEERSAFRRFQTPEEVDELAAALGKEDLAAATILHSYDVASLRSTLRALAKRHSALTKQLSLATLLSSASPTSD